MKISGECNICENSVSNGLGNYELIKVTGYEMWVCHSCFDGNHDGWNPRHSEKIILHLKSKGLSVPELNPRGWFPREC